MGQRPIYIAKSSSGRLELYDNKVVIKNLFQPQIEIYVKDITGVEFKRGILTGFIQIKSVGFVSTGVTQFLYRQQKVNFNSFSRSEFEKAKDLLEELITKKSLPAIAVHQVSLAE